MSKYTNNSNKSHLSSLARKLILLGSLFVPALAQEVAKPVPAEAETVKVDKPIPPKDEKTKKDEETKSDEPKIILPSDLYSKASLGSNESTQSFDFGVGYHGSFLDSIGIYNRNEFTDVYNNDVNETATGFSVNVSLKSLLAGISNTQSERTQQAPRDTTVTTTPTETITVDVDTEDTAKRSHTGALFKFGNLEARAGIESITRETSVRTTVDVDSFLPNGDYTQTFNTSVDSEENRQRLLLQYKWNATEKARLGVLGGVDIGTLDFPGDERSLQELLLGAEFEYMTPSAGVHARILQKRHDNEGTTGAVWEGTPASLVATGNANPESVVYVAATYQDDNGSTNPNLQAKVGIHVGADPQKSHLAKVLNLYEQDTFIDLGLAIDNSKEINHFQKEFLQEQFQRDILKDGRQFGIAGTVTTAKDTEGKEKSGTGIEAYLILPINENSGVFLNGSYEDSVNEKGTRFSGTYTKQDWSIGGMFEKINNEFYEDEEKKIGILFGKRFR